MRAVVYRLGWPLTFIGLVVALSAMISYFMADSELEQQWLEIASTSWRRGAADAIARERAQLTMWPGVLAGLAVTGLGIALIEVRRRTRDGWLERREMEGRFDDGRPIAFKPPEDKSS